MVVHWTGAGGMGSCTTNFSEMVLEWAKFDALPFSTRSAMVREFCLFGIGESWKKVKKACPGMTSTQLKAFGWS